MVLIVILSSKREFVTVYLHNFTLLRLFSNAHKRRVLVFLMLLLILFESGVKKEGLNQNSVCFLYCEVSHLRHELFELSTLKDASHAQSQIRRAQKMKNRPKLSLSNLIFQPVFSGLNSKGVGGEKRQISVNVICEFVICYKNCQLRF